MSTSTTTVAASGGSSLLTAIAQRVRHAYAIRRRRAAFARLAELDAEILDDIGLTYEDIEWGMSLPLKENAAVLVRARKSQEFNRFASA